MQLHSQLSFLSLKALPGVFITFIVNFSADLAEAFPFFGKVTTDFTFKIIVINCDPVFRLHLTHLPILIVYNWLL